MGTMWETTRMNRSGGNNDNNSGDPKGKSTTKDRCTKRHIVSPYMQGLGESIKNISKKYGIQNHFKGNKTIKNILVKPKDKDPMDRKIRAIYWYKCGELMCNDEYIGETSRTFQERYKEHLKEASPIFGHFNILEHTTNPDNFTIIGRGDHDLARAIKESIFIRVNNPPLSRNVGKNNLQHMEQSAI